jgi:hypothetical protein
MKNLNTVGYLKKNDPEYEKINTKKERERGLSEDNTLNRINSNTNKEYVLNEEILSKIPKENAEKIKNIFKNLDVDIFDQLKKSGKMDYDDNYFERVNFLIIIFIFFKAKSPSR